MIAVLDTNVIVSALLSPKGPPAAIIIRRWEADELGVVISSALLVELRRVLEYEFEYERKGTHIKAPQKTVAALVKRLETVAAVVEPQLSLDVIEEDPADNRVLECAVAGKAGFIVTGDAHLLKLKEYQGVVILNPAAFLVLAKLGKEG